LLEGDGALAKHTVVSQLNMRVNGGSNSFEDMPRENPISKVKLLR
jgi:hypothetical protein